MPVPKNPCKLKMANGDPGGPSKTLILEDIQGTNPFEEDLEENERDAFLGSISPESRKPPAEDRREFERGLFNGSPEERYRRRATLDKVVGLSPFRIGKNKKAGDKRSPNGEKGSDWKSFLGRMIPLTEGSQKKPRRCSEDFSLLQRFNGRRKESLCSLDCGLAEKENGGGDTLKRMSFLKIGLGGKVRRASLVEKLNQTEAPEPEPVTEEAETRPKEPLSILQIMDLIKQRDLLVADGHIIELEAECEQEGQKSPESSEAWKHGSRNAKDVELLYKALQEQLWAVLAESLAAKSTYQPLEVMVQVIEQEEERDRRWLEAKGETGGEARPRPRPRAMKKQWAEAVNSLVKQRLRQCTEGKAGSIGTQLDRLAKCAAEDLCTVKFHLLHAYPKEYEAFGVYLSSYHRGLAQWLAEVAQKSLSISELYFVLDWNSNIYKREVLSRAEISSLVKTQKLGPLLSPETQENLEEHLIAAVKDKITVDVNRELQDEEERWAQEDEGNSGPCSLSGKVIPVLKAHSDKAPQITQDFGMRMAHCCLASLAEFLQRDYVGHLARFGHPESEAAQILANCSLDRVTRLCNHVLADHLFQSLKPYFHKLMRRKWLNGSEAFAAIMALLEEHAQKLRTMKLEPYQLLVKEVHRRVLIEYVRPLMRVRIICNTPKMRAKVAGKLRSEAKRLQEFFIQLESAASWLDSVVPHLANIIELEDTAAIQMEVAFLAKKFPDVQKQHISAILDVRSLRNQGRRQSILAVMEDPELTEAEESLCQDQAFFSEIPTSKVFCVRVQLHRLSRLLPACGSRLSCRRPRRQGRRPKEVEAESQV
uniref:Exocyst complex component 3 like 2 n=1 Tax=Salvator merianae TaxID=96440 RepID=A0A8D0B8I8_SALMN